MERRLSLSLFLAWWEKFQLSREKARASREKQHNRLSRLRSIREGEQHREVDRIDRPDRQLRRRWERAARNLRLANERASERAIIIRIRGFSASETSTAVTIARNFRMDRFPAVSNGMPRFLYQ